MSTGSWPNVTRRWIAWAKMRISSRCSGFVRERFTEGLASSLQRDMMAFGVKALE